MRLTTVAMALRSSASTSSLSGLKPEAQEALDTLSRPQESEGASLVDAFSAAARSSLPGSSAGDGFTWVPPQFREFTRCCSLLPRAPSGPKEPAPALRGEATAALKE